MPVALITGAARENGIGAAVAHRLTAEGWDVATSDLSGTAYNYDLSDADAPDALIDHVRRDRGAVEALILAHAHVELSGVLDTTAASFDRHVAVNARASLLLVAAFARQAPTAGGAIVAFTSDHTAGNLPYGASKGALDRLVIAAARELGPAGISANVLNPGPVDTGWMDDATRRALTDRHPLGRMGETGDVADVVAFLVSPPGRWITGQLLHADGGFSAAS